jgi:hypothetical protein
VRFEVIVDFMSGWNHVRPSCLDVFDMFNS